MKLSHRELEYLSAWAREEWEPACYGLPAHRLQLARGVSGAALVDLIKAWTIAERRKDAEIAGLMENREPEWPWQNMDEFRTRWEEAQSRSQHEAPAA